MAKILITMPESLVGFFETEISGQDVTWSSVGAGLGSVEFEVEVEGITIEQLREAMAQAVREAIVEVEDKNW
jgi:hypothetical protein